MRTRFFPWGCKRNFKKSAEGTLLSLKLKLHRLKATIVILARQISKMMKISIQFKIFAAGIKYADYFLFPDNKVIR